MRIAHRTLTRRYFCVRPRFPLTRFLTLARPRAPSPLHMAAANVDNASAVSDVEKFGFHREEMYSSSLTGTVDAYDRHVFLCYKSPDVWPPRVEASETDPLPKRFASAVRARKDDIAVKTKVTVCEGGEGTLFADGDVLIFPEMIKYRGLSESNVDAFVDDVLVNGKPWASGVQEVVTGFHVFVCAHASRDRRCGVCGPVLIEKLKENIEVKGLKDQVFVSGCSHVGGHKYAGNLIIFSPDAEGKIMGHWYGYVTPEDVPEILDQHIGKGQIIERLWRGQMGARVEKDENTGEQKLSNGDLQKTEKHQESSTEQVENVTGCCQGASGFSCCRDGNVDQNRSEEVQSKKCLGKFSSFMGKWEQNDILFAAAVVGAVATVAVAYSFYRRSG